MESMTFFSATLSPARSCMRYGCDTMIMYSARRVPVVEGCGSRFREQTPQLIENSARSKNTFRPLFFTFFLGNFFDPVGSGRSCEVAGTTGQIRHKSGG